MGLFDVMNVPGVEPEQNEYLKRQQMLGLAAAILQASAPSTDPRSGNMGYALGKGIEGMNQGRQGGIDTLAASEKFKALIEAKKRQKILDDALKGVPTTKPVKDPYGIAPAGMKEDRSFAELLPDYVKASLQAGDVEHAGKMAALLQAVKPDSSKMPTKIQEYGALFPNKVDSIGRPIDAADYTAWLQSSENFKRPGTFQVGMMNGKTFAVQGNPNNNQLEYFDPGKKGWATVPEGMTFANQILSPQEVSMLGLPYGTTKGEAANQGVSAVPQAKREQLAYFDTAQNILVDIEKYSKKVNTFGAGPLGVERLGKGTANWLGGKTQTDPDVTALMNKTGELSMIIRALGERGALAEGDVTRGLKLIPTEFDTETVAKQKLRDLAKLFADNKQAFLSGFTTPIGGNRQSATKAPQKKLTFNPKTGRFE